MKTYLILILLLTILGEFRLSHLIDSSSPSQDLFSKPFEISGRFVEEDRGKGGLVPTINGRRLACGVSYRGVTRQCRLHGLEDGMSISGSMVLLPTLTGAVWVPLSMRLPDGSQYHASPETIMNAWKADSREDLIRLPIYVVVLLVGLPFLVIKR